MLQLIFSFLSTFFSAALASENKGTDIGDFALVVCFISLFFTVCLGVLEMIEDSKTEEAKRIERARKIEEERKRKQRRYF